MKGLASHAKGFGLGSEDSGKPLKGFKDIAK